MATFEQLLALQNPAPLLADAGVPMIFLTLPLMIGALIPVILIEVWIARPLLGLNYRQTAKAIAAANVTSTLIGVPLAWIATFAFDMLVALAGHKWLDKLDQGPVLRVMAVVLFPAWLAPDEPNFFWALPVAAMVLLIPSFFASWYIEAFVIKRQMIDVEWGKIRFASFKANLFSYGFLVMAACAWLVFSIYRAP